MRRPIGWLPIAGMVVASALGFAGTASADPFTISTVVGGVPGTGTALDMNGLALGNAGGTVGGVTVGFSGNAQVVQGAQAGVYAAPYLSGAEGAFFGGGNGPASGRYFTAGNDLAAAGSGVTFGFSVPQIAFDLLWGSIDTYNRIEVYNGATLLGTIHEALPDPAHPGDQGADGSAYVSVSSATPFTSLVFASDGWAFEFADFTSVAEPGAGLMSDPPLRVPEPGSLALLGAGLVLLGVARFTSRRVSAF